MEIVPLQSLYTNNPAVTDAGTNMSSVPFYINNDTMPTVVSFSFIESTGKLLPQVASKNSHTNEPVKMNDELAIEDNKPTVSKPMITNDDLAL